MIRFRRMAISFCIVLNIAIMGLFFLALANSQTVEDTVFIATSDARMMYVGAVFGVPLNIALGMLLWQGSARSRALEQRSARGPVDRTKI